jgi:uncharacterized membrane protein
MLLMGLVPLLVLGLIVWLVLEATHRHEDWPPPQAWAPPPSQPDACALLDERYARDEIEGRSISSAATT